MGVENEFLWIERCRSLRGEGEEGRLWRERERRERGFLPLASS